MNWKIALFVICAVIGKTTGLRCYTCSFSATDSDQSCLGISDTTNRLDCPHKYCTIFRQEFIDPRGVVVSFNRGCESVPDHLNHEIVDPTFRTIYRACTTDLCNIGDGIAPVVAGLSPYPQYDGDNLLVPGTGRGGASNLTISLILMILCITTIFF